MHSDKVKNMKVGLARLFFILIGVLNAIIVPAQKLPILPQDPAVKCSVLPDGLSCYVAGNVASKGFADFVLIRKDYTGNETLCSFEDIITSSETTVDSTLFHLMSRVAADAAPADCAVIVCGDVNVESVTTKLKYMSMMIAPSTPSSLPEYSWDGEEKARLSSQIDTLKGLATVRCEWDAPRAPVQQMNTIQFAVYEKAVWELGNVARRWIARNLKRLDIPVADISYRHSGGKNLLSHENFVIEVTVAEEDVKKAEDTMISILTALDAGNVHYHDIVLAENDYLMTLDKSASHAVRSNDEYVRLCRDAFLYNCPISRDRQRLDFFRSKDISENVRKEIFTSITSALLKTEFSADSTTTSYESSLLSDMLSLPDPYLKEKIRSTRKDGFSEGVLWTFNNGIKVIYKKMPTNGTLYYSLSLNGGYGNIEDLERGEGVYMSAYPDHSWISGVKGADFRNMLNLSGMTMNVRVNLFNTAISGQVKDRNVSLMMQGLLAISNECRKDTVAAGYHIRSEKINRKLHDGDGVKAILDSLMCPGYRYAPYKTDKCVSQETYAKAETLFSNLMSKVNDGVLVIVGDMDETSLKKQLQTYVGGFKVRNVASRRPSMKYHTVSGWSAYCADGQRDAILLVVSGRWPMTAANHFAAEVAGMVFERRIKDAFKGRDISVRVSHARSIYPEERFSMMVELDGTSDQNDVEILRTVLSSCAETLDGNIVSAYKAYLENAYTLQKQTPEYWLRVIPLRHLEGKDFTTGHAAKIGSVTPDHVKAIFDVLNGGAGVEYIIRKK